LHQATEELEEKTNELMAFRAKGSHAPRNQAPIDDAEIENLRLQLERTTHQLEVCVFCMVCVFVRVFVCDLLLMMHGGCVYVDVCVLALVRM
jgi:hypothetical protein